MTNSQNSKIEFVAEAGAPKLKEHVGIFRTTLTIIALLVGEFFALSYATEKFRIISTEDARRLSIQEYPRQIPAAASHDQSGGANNLADYLKSDGRVTIVNFIYTKCNAVCSVLGSEFQQLQQQILEQNLKKKIRLLSITFDERDRTDQLSAYAKRMRANTQIWNFLSIDNRSDRQKILTTFGVVAIPAPLDEFVHNAAFHVVDANGALVRVIDFDQAQTAINFAVSKTN